MTERGNPDALPSGYRLHWYTLERVLGQGGFGITYLARDENLDQPVAIKEYLPVEIAARLPDVTVRARTEEQDERYRWGLKRFIDEARTLARFDHPAIVRVHSVFEANDTAYMVMRFEEGENLATALERRGTLPEAEILRILMPILDGLELVHGTGFIHRDVKPDNIHLRADGTPVLLDFGSARHAIGKSRTLTILVAPGYAPLEQYYSDPASQGPWTDIYGLAATCYRAIAGVAPIDAIARSKGILGSVQDVLPPAAVVGRGRYSEKLLAAIDHGLAFAEKDRPQSIAQWRRDLADDAPAPAPVVEGTATSAAGHVAAAAAPAPNRRSQFSPVLWSVVGAVIAAVSVAWMVRPDPVDRAAEQRIAAMQAQVAAERRQLDEQRARDAAERERERVLAAQSRVPEPPAADVAKPPVQPAVKPAIVQKPAAREPAPAPPPRALDTAPKRAPAAAPGTVARAPDPGDGPRPAPPAMAPATALATPAIDPGDAATPSARVAEPATIVPASPAPPAAKPPRPATADALADAERLLEQGDYARAATGLRQLADRGNAAAQARLAELYADGRGVTRSPYQAYVWYSLAARGGHAAADGGRRRTSALLQPAEISQADRLVDARQARREESR